MEMKIAGFSFKGVIIVVIMFPDFSLRHIVLGHHGAQNAFHGWGNCV
jgi:hypothetical protein